MPVLSDTEPTRKRRTSVWWLVLTVVTLPLVGVFAWSCFQPVLIPFGGWEDSNNEPRMNIGFGYHSFRSFPLRGSERGRNLFLASPTFGIISVNLPEGCYLAGWDLQ